MGAIGARAGAMVSAARVAMPSVSAEGAIATTKINVARREDRVPSALRCGLFLFAVKVMLKTVGFARTLHWIRRRTEWALAERHGDAAVVGPTADAVALAAAVYPGRALCLEQSLALYHYLRRAGVQAEFRLGVQPHPFVAHAWVECRGALINDMPERVAQFQPLAGDFT